MQADLGIDWRLFKYHRQTQPNSRQFYIVRSPYSFKIINFPSNFHFPIAYRVDYKTVSKLIWDIYSDKFKNGKLHFLCNVKCLIHKRPKC